MPKVACWTEDICNFSIDYIAHAVVCNVGLSSIEWVQIMQYHHALYVCQCCGWIGGKHVLKPTTNYIKSRSRKACVCTSVMVILHQCVPTLYHECAVYAFVTPGLMYFMYFHYLQVWYWTLNNFEIVYISHYLCSMDSSLQKLVARNQLCTLNSGRLCILHISYQRKRHGDIKQTR